MSRIGKHPVSVPQGVQVALAGQTLTVSGKLGTLEHTLPGDVQVAQNDGAIVVQPRGDGKRARAMWGLSRTLVANMVEGVSKGFTRKLLISGVGFRVPIASASARSPRNCARSAGRSPTRARASAMTTR
jgi:large subunit ribosomal protein L6